MEPTESDSAQTSPPRSLLRGRPKRIAWFLFGYIILLVVSVPYLIPPIPKTKLGWLGLLVIGPPGYLLGEWLVGKFSAPWGESNRLLKAAGVITFVLAAMIVWVLFTA